jgi:hypothetical protein
MTASFIPASFRKSIIISIIALSLVGWVFPSNSAFALSETEAEQNQPNLEVKNLNLKTEISDKSLTLDTVIANDPLVNNLKLYLEKHRSPLAEYAGEMIKQPQWQRALAISWVESNFCKRHVDNNCSGIGVAPGHKLWRKYETHLDWFKDMSALMEKPIYKEKYTTFQKMRGVYVQPGSANWVNGAQKKYNELIKLTQESEVQKITQISQKNNLLALTTLTDPEQPE